MAVCCTCGKKFGVGVKSGSGNEGVYCSKTCVVVGLNSKYGWEITEEDVMTIEWGFKPEKIEEKDRILNGTYIASIEGLGRKSGISEKTGNEYDFYFIKLRVVKTLTGEKGEKWGLDGIYNPDTEGVKTLAGLMFNAGIELDTSSEEKFEASFEDVIGKLITVRAWKAKKFKKVGDGFEPIDGEFRQKWTVPTKQADTSGVDEDSDVIF